MSLFDVLFNKDNQDEKIEKECNKYALDNKEKKEVKKGSFNPWSFEEEDLEEEDYFEEE